MAKIMGDLCGPAGAVFNCIYLFESFKREIKTFSYGSGGLVIREQC